MCAALSAREAGARVLVVEKAPEAWRGGNGFFTAGGFRFAFKSFEELCELVGDLSDDEKASMEVDPYQAAARAGIDVRFETKATRLVTDERGAVTGVVVRTPAGTETIPASAVVLAAGGFEANPEMRSRYLGRNWDLARVRGTPYNTGDAIHMA